MVEPGATERELYLPPGHWVDFWRAVAYREKRGGLRLRRARVLAGRHEETVPAPLEELPLMVRAGAVLPLLPADVDTLASYGPGPDAVPLSRRRGRLDLIAFPRGRWKGTFFKGERIESREGNRKLTLAHPRQAAPHVLGTDLDAHAEASRSARAVSGYNAQDAAWRA